jgi:uncharacterized membrane protein (UPF0127 family)
MPLRLRRLPRATVAAALDVRVAVDLRARLLGLAGLAVPPPRAGLLLPSTRSIHTCGMRFALDLLWLGADGGAVRFDQGVPPWRLRACRGARSVIELGAGTLSPQQATDLRLLR